MTVDRARWLRSRRRASVLLCALALAGCADLTSLNDVRVETPELRHASNCNSTSGAAAVTLLRDADALRRWQQAHQVDLIGDAPIPAGPYAVVEHGARNVAGYAVVVASSAWVSGNVLALQASFLSPASNQLHAEMLTSPCALIQLPPGNYDAVELFDTRGRRRAISSAPPPPTPATSTPAQ
jgi:hypothetical protein